MPGLAKELNNGDCFIIQPLGTHMKTMTDEDLIDDVSVFEARQEYCRWTINEATIAYYNHLLGEWQRRYKNKHIPRKVFSRREIIEEFALIWPDQYEDE